ncbi:unnamed protein product [Danaus chrysippus]|uniref:(African queen) hypothetical protein n=1 Tax=Danaus chrysippus TaxID=151541 RepID=A0A8J2QWS1_9NEOP|nr:unnamed protein product [Danaus chrysippus]
MRGAGRAGCGATGEGSAAVSGLQVKNAAAEPPNRYTARHVRQPIVGRREGSGDDIVSRAPRAERSGRAA